MSESSVLTPVQTLALPFVPNLAKVGLTVQAMHFWLIYVTFVADEHTAHWYCLSHLNALDAQTNF